MCNDRPAINALEHSNEAISVSAQFYNKQVMVFVEGPDDVPFWDAMFGKVVPRSFYEIATVNGKEQLVPYIEGIEKGTIRNAFVATDLDYSLFSEQGRSTCSYVIYTYGHSIENTMFCPKSVAAYLRRAMKRTTEYTDSVNRWFEHLLSSARPLLAMDILNSIDTKCVFHKSNGDNTFLGRGFYYFQNQTQKKDIAIDRIENERNSHIDFDPGMLGVLEKQIEIQCETRDPRFLFQGHFIADAVMNYIRVTLKENKLNQMYSKDSFYVSFCDCIEHCNPLCHDKQHVCDYINKAVKDYYQSKASA